MRGSGGDGGDGGGCGGGYSSDRCGVGGGDLEAGDGGGGGGGREARHYPTSHPRHPA